MKTGSVPVAVALLATTCHAFFGAQPPPKPKTERVAGFLWTDPSDSEAINSFEATCEVQKIFDANEYTLHDLMKPPPEGLYPWSSGLKAFFAGREYPGSWGGFDRHLHDRTLLSMEYKDMPLEVRLWIEEEEREGGEGKGLFGIFDKPATAGHLVHETVEFPRAAKVDRSQDKDKIAIFAPGALFHILPLWVVEGSDCKGDLADMTKYKPQPEDGAVVSWADHKLPKEDEHQIQFRIRAQVLKAKEAPESKAETAKESETASRDEL